MSARVHALCLGALLMLSACATRPSAAPAWEAAAGSETRACDDPAADQCVVLACDEGTCGVFGCEDVDPEAVTGESLAPRVELARAGAYRPPMRGPGPSRNWRRTGLRDGVRPRLTFHFRYRHGFLPAVPRAEGKLIKHHLFPQAPDLARWFERSGINIHEWTMAIPEHLHLRIHSGGPRGGLWNQAWRDFRDANRHRRVSKDELLRKAFELAYRFDIVGPLVNYRHPIVPPGPQLFAD